jgi:hypothetical protein
MEAFRRSFLTSHRTVLVSSLRGLFGETDIEPAPIDKLVNFRFMDAMKRASASKKMREVKILAGFHGTSLKNHPSIFDRGLLIPGDGNDLNIVHGAAYGRGVYVAQQHAAWLSFGFCSAPKMFICAVLDAGHVTYHGDAMVVANSAHVLPLFVASGFGFRHAGVVLSLSRKAQRHIAAASNTSRKRLGEERSTNSQRAHKLCWDENETDVHW